LSNAKVIVLENRELYRDQNKERIVLCYAFDQVSKAVKMVRK
jgi:hypothetical protein